MNSQGSKEGPIAKRYSLIEANDEENANEASENSYIEF